MVKDVRDIGRVALAHTDDVEAELRGAVLTQAHELFGYTADSFATRGPLASKLAELGVQPLNQVQVDQYKASKKKKWRMRWRALGHFTASFGLPAVFWLTSIYLVRPLFQIHWAKSDDFQFADLLWMVPFVLTVASLCLGNGFASECLEDVDFARVWTTYVLGRSNADYNTYPRYVPVHLLNYAVAIKQAMPNAVFLVEELQLTRERVPNPLPDPFLVVTLGSERYTIGVWDEREFEAKA